MSANASSIVMLSGRRFVIACAIVACLLLAAGRAVPMPLWLLAAEIGRASGREGVPGILEGS
jgi:hypothetical protein